MKHIMLILILLGVLAQLVGCRLSISSEPTNTPAPAHSTPDPPSEELEELEERLNTTDLSIQITARPDTVGVNERIVYSLLVTNEGPNPASEVQVVNHLSDGVAYLSSSVDCRESPARTLTCDLGELLARESATVTIEVSVEESAPATIHNVATIANLAGPDPNPENNTEAIDVQRLQ